MITKCLSNNKDLKVMVLDYDTQTENPSYEEIECENVTAKDIRIHIEEATEDNEGEPEPFGDIFKAMGEICNPNNSKF